jgi:hypothetical protein
MGIHFGRLSPRAKMTERFKMLSQDSEKSWRGGVRLQPIAKANQPTRNAVYKSAELINKTKQCHSLTHWDVKFSID